MIAQMDAAGVDRAVIVPPTWIGENNSTAIEASLAYPGRFATMGRFDPMRLDYGDALATWREQPYMLGIRMTFRVPPYDQWLKEFPHTQSLEAKAQVEMFRLWDQQVGAQKTK